MPYDSLLSQTIKKYKAQRYTYKVREASAVSNRNFLRLLVQTTVTVCWSRPT